MSSTQRQYYPAAVADECPLSRVTAEGGMSFRTPWSSWDSGNRAVSFLGELSLLPHRPVMVVVVGIQTIQHVCTNTSISSVCPCPKW